MSAIRKIEYVCGIVAYPKDDGWHLRVEGWRARLLPPGQGWLSNDVYPDLDAVTAAVERIGPALDEADEREHRLTSAKQHLLREIMAAGRVRAGGGSGEPARSRSSCTDTTDLSANVGQFGTPSGLSSEHPDSLKEEAHDA